MERTQYLVPWTARTLPLVAVRDAALFPGQVSTLSIGRPATVAAIRAGARLGAVLAVAQRRADVDQPGPDDLHQLGCVARVVEVGGAGEVVTARVYGVLRARVVEHVAGDDPAVRFDAVADPLDTEPPLDGMMISLLTHMARGLLRKSGSSRKVADAWIAGAASPGRLADLCLGHLSLTVAQQQAMLEAPVLERVHAVLDPDRLDFAEPDASSGFLARLFRRP